jgi:hypothetical protein
VEALGLEVAQVAEVPFHTIRHVEWNQDRPGGPFTHKAVMLRQLRQLREENGRLRQELERPTFRQIGALLRRRFVHALGRTQ